MRNEEIELQEERRERGLTEAPVRISLAKGDADVPLLFLGSIVLESHSRLWFLKPQLNRTKITLKCNIRSI